MLLAHFRIVRSAYEGLQAILPAPSNHRAKNESVHQPKPVSTKATFFGKGVTLLPDGEEPDQHETASGRDGAEGSTTYAAESHNEETGKRCSRGAAKSVRRESRIVLWALRDAAARVVQEETRGYARRRRWLSGSGQRQGVATTDETNVEGAFHESFTREDEDRFDEGYQAADGGLPWGLNARLTTAVTADTSTTASSTRGTIARTSTAKTTVSASSARRRTQGGSGGPTTREDRFDQGYKAPEEGLPWGQTPRMSTAVTITTTTASSTRATTARTATGGTTATASSARRGTQGGCRGQSTSYVSSRSPITLDSAVSPTWRFPCTSTGLGFPDGGDVATEVEWGSEEAWAGGKLHTQQAEVVGKIVDRVVARWPLLPSEELKKR